MYCNCSNVGASKAAIGYHLRDDGIWTHALCDRPSKLYLKGVLERMPTDLNLLQGGPAHNAMLDNDEIQDRNAILAHGQHVLDCIDDYRWTAETLTGQSGRVARIWRYDPRPKGNPYERTGTQRKAATSRG